MPNLSCAIIGLLIFKSRDIYVGLVCLYEQNGSQYFVLCPRIAELWRIKGCKVEKLEQEDLYAFFKAGLWQSGFSYAAKNGIIFSRN